MPGSWDEPLTYCGFLDDMVAAVEPAGRIDGLSLELEMTKSLLEGRPLAINDGYFFLNPAIQQSMVREWRDPGCTVLGRLLESGRIYILSRNGGRLDTLVEEMADNQLRTYEALRSHADWRETLKPAVSHCLALAPPGNALSWPAVDLGEAFYAHADAAVLRRRAQASSEGLSQTLFEDIHGRARETFAESRANARQTWFDCVEAHTPAEARQALKAFGVETYHQAFGSALAAEGQPMHVQTQATGLYDDLYQLRTVEAELRTITIRPPEGLLKADPAKFSSLFAAHSAVLSARTEFLRARRVYFDRPGDRSAFREYRMAAFEYEARILDHFGLVPGRFGHGLRAARRSFALGGAGFGFVVETMLGIPPIASVGLGVAFYWLEQTQLEAQRLKVSNAVARQAGVNVMKVSSGRKKQVEFLDVPVRREAAQAVLKDVRRFDA